MDPVIANRLAPRKFMALMKFPTLVYVAVKIPMANILPQRAARLRRELDILRKSESEAISINEESEFPNAVSIDILGPYGTPYEEQIFKIRVTFSTRYPFEPPTMIFETPIYHPNIDNCGRICLDLLKMSPAASEYRTNRAEFEKSARAYTHTRMSPLGLGNSTSVIPENKREQAVSSDPDISPTLATEIPKGAPTASLSAITNKEGGNPRKIATRLSMRKKPRVDQE